MKNIAILRKKDSNFAHRKSVLCGNFETDLENI